MAKKTVKKKPRPEVPKGKKKTRRQDGESEFGPFVASPIKSHFHRPDCKWAAYISPAKIVEFETHREAVDSGRKPCKTCKA